MSKDVIGQKRGIDQFPRHLRIFHHWPLTWGLVDRADKARNLFTINKMMWWCLACWPSGQETRTPGTDGNQLQYALHGWDNDGDRNNIQVLPLFLFRVIRVSSVSFSWSNQVEVVIKTKEVNLQDKVGWAAR